MDVACDAADGGLPELSERPLAASWLDKPRCDSSARLRPDQPYIGLPLPRSTRSELVDKARTNGPQIITKSGKTAVVVVSAAEWDRKTRRSGNLAEFFAESPLGGSGLEAPRTKDQPRKVEL